MGAEAASPETGPNGWPYLENCRLGKWETGDYYLKIEGADGRTLRLNMTPEQFRALRHAAADVAERGGDGRDD